MEIISYLGYQPNKSKVKYFFNRFITQKKTKSSVLFDFSQSQNFVNRSNYVPSAKVSAKLVLISLGRFVSYVAENIKSILKFESRNIFDDVFFFENPKGQKRLLSLRNGIS